MREAITVSTVDFTSPVVAVRDSKNPAAGILAFPESAWVTFLAGSAG
jgi:hypothetical protein